MKKIYSLIKACMTSDMQLFRFKIKSNNKGKTLIPLFISGYLMFAIGMSVNSLFEKFAPLNLSCFLLALIVLSISLMTLIEGIYKTSSLIFNCKDDQLLFSLPIKKRTILFVRIFKFYLFELVFNSLLLLPVMIIYLKWGINIDWTYFLTCLVMLLLIPIIPIVLSCIIGAFIASLSSRFKYKNASQIIISMLFLLGVLFISFNANNILEYVIANASNMNELIIKIYYPAGMFAKLITQFNFKDLLIFVLVNVGLFTIMVFSLSKFYFKISSRLKNARVDTKKIKLYNFRFKKNNQTKALIKKEINTYFKIPVFIINTSFSLLIFIIIVVVILLKFDSILPMFINSENELQLSKDTIMNNLSVLIFILVSLASFMTSITNSVISLEGKSISILKSLPIKVKTILISKVYSALLITTPVLLVGNILLFIKFKINVMEMILLIILSILIPLVSHFIGLIINLKYPKLNWESATEVVKQSLSSFLAVMIGIVLFMVTVTITLSVIGKITSVEFLLIATIIYITIDWMLYLYLIRNGINDFKRLVI